MTTKLVSWSLGSAPNKTPSKGNSIRGQTGVTTSQFTAAAPWRRCLSPSIDIRTYPRRMDFPTLRVLVLFAECHTIFRLFRAISDYFSLSQKILLRIERRVPPISTHFCFSASFLHCACRRPVFIRAIRGQRSFMLYPGHESTFFRRNPLI
jgi:hypothetical protein